MLITHAKTGSPQLVTGAKTDAGVRDIPVTAEFMQWLLGKKREARSVFVFPNSKGGMFSAGAYTALWLNLQKHISFHVHPHMLRHTYVTKLFEQGLDITEIQTVVGHADPSLTLETYTHYRADTRKASTGEKVRAARRRQCALSPGRVACGARKGDSAQRSRTNPCADS